MTTEHTLAGWGLGYRAGGRDVLDHVDVVAKSGELLAVTGPSGAGKSTLLTLLAGLERPHAGVVELDGAPLGATPDERRRFGLQFQQHGLVAALTAAENVAVPLQARGLPRRDVRARVMSRLESVGLGDEADRLAEELSGGQRQRVALARALVGEPDVVLADEPTSELDPDSRGAVLDLLVRCAERGAIVVVASHDPEVAAIAHQTVALRDGRVVA